MRLTRLVLEDFRNYAAAELHPEPGLTIVAGPNGAGKTNLLEAIHVAITGRSHRAGADGELVRHGAGFARVRLDLVTDGGDPARLELVIPGPNAPAEIRKRLTLNGVPRRVGGISDAMRAVLFRPEEMLLLIGAPSERRRLLDSILAQQDRRAARDLAEAARILAQRNALLRAIRREEATLDQLAFWDEGLAELGGRVLAARMELVSAMGRRLPALHDAVAPPAERGEAVRIEYSDTLKDAWPERDTAGTRSPGAAELSEALRRRIREVRAKELWNGVSLVGPQRDDVRIWLAGREVATHASRGQQRTIILALKLAETELLALDGAPRPIILLDDVFSELDPERAERALGMLLQRGQVLVTTADLAQLPSRARRGVAVWRVGDGLLTRPPRVA
jgi:DNA replication and repair protein RecF